AAIHERQRLGHHPRRLAKALGHERFRHLPWRHRPRELVPPRELVGHHEADVVPRLAILLARVAQPDDQTHDNRYFLSFLSLSAPSSSLSVLPFLMTSGSAPAAAGAASAAAVADSSAFGITTWTSIVSPSVTGFHLASAVTTSRTRIDWCSSSSLTSTSMCSGIFAGRHST